MSRAGRIYYNNVVSHVIVRGNNRQMILKKKEDKENFLMSVAKHKQRFNFKLYGFVLMDNHVHMVMETGPINNISKIMHSILLSFSVKYRKRTGYVGYVWQGRFKNKIIEGEKYVLECIDYIHNNPVRAKMVSSPEKYIWSSYWVYSEGTNKTVEPIIDLDQYGDSSTRSN